MDSGIDRAGSERGHRRNTSRCYSATYEFSIVKINNTLADTIGKRIKCIRRCCCVRIRRCRCSRIREGTDIRGYRSATSTENNGGRRTDRSSRARARIIRRGGSGTRVINSISRNRGCNGTTCRTRFTTGLLAQNVGNCIGIYKVCTLR